MPTLNPDRILFQDQWFLAVHKLPQELVVRGKGPLGKLPLLDFLRPQFPGVRPLSRLDFDTSGVVLFARTKESSAKVIESKYEGWKKIYHALVAGIIPKDQGDIRFPLPARMSGDKVPAHTAYTVLERFIGCTLVECTIESGKHHQIRRHFALIKHPLLLDDVYGDRKTNISFTKAFRYRRFFLHAAAVEFVHPFTGQPVRIEAPRPKAFEEVLRALAKAVSG